MCQDNEFKELLDDTIGEITKKMKRDLNCREKAHWKTTEYGKKISVERLVAEFNLNSVQIFPYTHCKARVWYRGNDEYIAYPNIGIIDMTNEYTEDWICGGGSTIEEALNDLISNLIELICKYETKFGRKLIDKDYCYSDPHDF